MKIYLKTYLKTCFMILMAGLSAGLLFFAPESFAEDLPQQTLQLENQLKDLQADFNQVKKNQLILGNEQTQIEKINYLLDNIQQILKNFKNIENSRQNLNFLWVSNEDLKNKNNLFNVNTQAQPVYICRAEFLGASMQSQGVYPGQLTASQDACRISYAGYAFLMSKYDVLTGDQKNKLQWLPIKKVKEIFQISVPVRLPVPVPVARWMPYLPYIPPQNYLLYHIQPVNGIIPVAGGYEGDKPVYICKVNYKNNIKIGKLVTFRDNTGNLQDACDIGVLNKEVVIEQGYDLLLTQSNAN